MAAADVSSLIADARIFAAETLSAGQGPMGAAMAAVEGLQGGFTDPFKSILLHIDPPGPESPGAVPKYDGPTMIPDDYTGDKSARLQAVGPFTAPGDPAGPPADLTFNDPTQPSGEPDPGQIGAPPVLNPILAIPATPDLMGEIAGIAKPVIVPITIPAAPAYVPPEFTGVAPTFTTAMPTGLDVAMQAQYASISPQMMNTVSTQLDVFIDKEFPSFRIGMAAIETRLATYLAGGSALSPAVESAMVGRTLDKTNAEGRKALAEAMGKGARAGFTIMGPTLLSQAQDIDQQRRDGNVRAMTEVYVKQAELEQSNLQFAVTKSSELRKIALDASLSYYSGMVNINGQALQYARDVVDFIVKAFDIAARYAETQARIYEADANVYRARVEGALAAIRAYESTIRGLEAQVNVNRSLVETYKARIEAVQAEANVFTAAVNAVVAAAGLERIKVELFDARVKAYASQVNAYTARWQGYGEAVRGQSARMQVNVENQKSYEARWNGYTAKVNGLAKGIEAVIATNNGLLANVKSQVDIYTTLEHSKLESTRINQELYKLTLDAYRANAQSIQDKNIAVRANYELGLRGLTLAANMFIEEMREVDNLRIKRAEGISQIATAVGGEYARVAQAALVGMNTLAASVNTSTS